MVSDLSRGQTDRAEEGLCEVDWGWADEGGKSDSKVDSAAQSIVALACSRTSQARRQDDSKAFR